MNNFNNLWQEFNDEIFKYIQSKVQNKQDAEDLLQLVFLKVHKGIDKVNEKDALKSWLYKITRNTIIDYYRKRKDILKDPDEFKLIEDQVDDEDNMNDIISDCISKMIFDLPDKYIEVYDLHENREMKHREISEALDISVSTSKVRLNRAKKMFKDKLLACCDFQVDKYGNIIDYNRKGECLNCDDKC